MKKALTAGLAALLLWGAPLPTHAVAASEPTWSTCRPHTFSISPAGMTKADVALTVRAVSTISKLTGIPFVYAGTKTWRPGKRPATELVIATSGTSPRLGAHRHAETLASVDAGTITAALIRVDLRGWAKLRPWEKRNVMLHELGHAVGLDHVDGADEVMNPVIRPVDPGLSRGFVAALKGLDATCEGSQEAPKATFDAESGVISWPMGGEGSSYKVQVSTPSASGAFVVQWFEGGLSLEALDRERFWPGCVPAPLTVSVRPLASNGALGEPTVTTLDVGPPCL